MLLRITLTYIAACCTVFVACGGSTQDTRQTEDGGTWNNSGGTTAGIGGSNGGATSVGGSTANTGGATTVPTQCTNHTDCVLTPTTCCGTCGAPTSNDVIAISSNALDAYRQAACGGGVVPCPNCATQLNPDLFATCDAGTCKTVDLATHAVSRCTTPADCRIRAASCCECGASMNVWELVAVANGSVADYASLVCDPNSVCNECLPIYPTDLPLICSNGHCALPRI